MPDYEFICDNKGCSNGGKITVKTFGVNDDKFSNCSKCGNVLRRKYSFTDQYKGDSDKSADTKEEKDVFRDNRKIYK